MKPVGNVGVYLTGSQKKVKRVLYSAGLGKGYFIKWYGKYIEVYNIYNQGNATSGWQTIEKY